MAGLLSSAGVIFILPKGDDRDADTRIELSIHKQDGTYVTYDGDLAHNIRFADPGTYGPYKLHVLDAGTDIDDLIAGNTRMTIYPNGHDRWITQVLIVADWTDNTRTSYSSATMVLNQGGNSAVWQNAGNVTRVYCLKKTRGEAKRKPSGIKSRSAEASATRSRVKQARTAK